MKSKIKALTPITAYQLLPRTNCGECGQSNCLAFATKLANREEPLEKCTPLLKKQYLKKHRKLTELLQPVVREIVIGVGKRAVKVGGKYVMCRHELMYPNPTAFAIDVTDQMPPDDVTNRVRWAEQFSFEYIGQTLKLDMIAVRCTSNDPQQFKAAVATVAQNTSLPLMLCSLDAKVLEAGLEVADKSRPLLYAATKNNWKNMAELALTHKCPLTVCAPNDLKLLKSLAKTLLACGIQDLVLDPGTSSNNGLAETINNLTMIRRAACKKGDKLLGFPLLGTPLTAWVEMKAAPQELVEWREAYTAAMLMVRFADILVLHSVDGWATLPPLVLRQNLYSDPRRPATVKPELKAFGSPDADSPVLFTANFALTYYTVASDIEKAKLNAYLLVVDTEGIAVDSAVAGRKLTPEKVANALAKSGIENKVNHRTLVIPGKAARLAAEIERLSGWKTLIGPKDSSDIPEFLNKNWPTQPPTH